MRVLVSIERLPSVKSMLNILAVNATVVIALFNSKVAVPKDAGRGVPMVVMGSYRWNFLAVRKVSMSVAAWSGGALEFS